MSTKKTEYPKYGRRQTKYKYTKHVVKFGSKTIAFPITCELCGKKIKSLPAFTTHMLRHHHIDIDDYIFQNFKLLNPDFKLENCGFCSKTAIPTIDVNFDTQEYSLSYPDGYMCFTPECRDNICLKFFGVPYSEAIHQYEHLGAKTEYLALRYKVTEEYVQENMKQNKDFVMPVSGRTSLAGYIARYGKIEGPKKYKERNAKISKAQTIEWYIEHYGIDEGTKRFQSRFEKIRNASSDITHSKNQYKIFDSLKEVDQNWKDERFAGGFAQVDMMNTELGTIIEYFGNYWHCNPACYEPDFYNKSLKCTAAERQEYDLERLTKILDRSTTCTLIIVVWEKTFFDYKEDVYKLRDKIYNIIEKHNRRKNSKKEIIWL